jgi:hypothetical protein
VVIDVGHVQGHVVQPLGRDQQPDDPVRRFPRPRDLVIEPRRSRGDLDRREPGPRGELRRQERAHSGQQLAPPGPDIDQVERLGMPECRVDPLDQPQNRPREQPRRMRTCPEML